MCIGANSQAVLDNLLVFSAVSIAGRHVYILDCTKRLCFAVTPISSVPSVPGPHQLSPARETGSGPLRRDNGVFIVPRLHRLLGLEPATRRTNKHSPRDGILSVRQELEPLPGPQLCATSHLRIWAWCASSGPKSARRGRGLVCP